MYCLNSNCVINSQLVATCQADVTLYTWHKFTITQREFSVIYIFAVLVQTNLCFMQLLEIH